MLVKELIKKLQKVKNKNSVVCFCEPDREYIEFSDIIDESIIPIKGNDEIGVVVLTLESNNDN